MKDKFPEPSVTRIWSAPPVATGSFKVYAVSPVIVVGACKPTYAEPVLSPNLNAPSVSIKTFVPSQVKLADAPKAPELLNWICVFDPPGNPPTTISTISGLVTWLPFALIILEPLSVADQVTLDPEPVIYSNSTVCAPDVAFSIK